MGLTGTTLVLVSLAFLRERCSPQLPERNETRIGGKKEKAATFTAGTLTPVHGTNFPSGTEKNAFTTMEIEEHVENGECHLNTNSGVPTHNDDYTPSPTEKPKTKKEEPEED
uniref:Putative secreted salivary gland protein 2 n=1 Tax=Ixodes ricinus TaxID=34613 RepID=V5GMH6_IXORI